MKILLIEDNPVVQRMYKRDLTQAGMEVTTGSDGIVAVPLALSYKPDVIMMDVMMPTMDGIDALAQLKQNPETKDIPVIMLSAADDGRLLEQAMHLGASRYLVKSSLEIADLVSMIQDTYNDVVSKQ